MVIINGKVLSDEKEIEEALKKYGGKGQNYRYSYSSDGDENFSSIGLNSNMTLPKSFEKGPLGALPSTDTNSHIISRPITQPNLATKVNTTASTQNGLFFQDEAHLIQWLKMHKDLILQVLNEIFSLPTISNQPVLSNQVS